ncbi:MAG: hypothetical protein ACXU9U_03655 [Parachlamydiaceae bacterium]
MFDRDEAPYRSPTERQLEYETPRKIKSILVKKGVNVNKYWPFWKAIAAQEERGIFGYHAAKQELRIFHDIIKMIFEEIVGFEIKKDFFFFRVPLDPSIHDYATAQDFIAKFPRIDDGIPQQRDQVISLNYSLFGNFVEDSQCTVIYFSKNHSWFRINYTDRLKFLFDQLGIPLKDISFLFGAGSEIKYFNSGVIYQFFDQSHHAQNSANAYTLLDTFSYPALGGGRFDFQVTERLSDLFQDTSAKKFDTGTGQLRLIMNNLATLNPFTSLSIRRYDLIAPQILVNYERELRSRIQQLSFDPIKVQIYKEKLKAFWYVQE